MKKIFSVLASIIFLLGLTFTTVDNNTTYAATKWGKIEFKEDMIGKVKIVKDTYNYSIKNNKLVKGKKIKKGKEYGVYSYSNKYSGIYKIGQNTYVKKSSSIKYYKASKKLINDAKGYGTVKGVITWQYNSYIGTKPDVGAKIFLIPTNFNPKDYKKEDLELYAMVGSTPKNSNLFFGKADGYGNYEIANVTAGKYILIVSSRKTTRDPNEEVYIEKELKKLLGDAYQRFYDFNIGNFNNYTFKYIEVKKNNTVPFSHDFGYTYI